MTKESPALADWLARIEQLHPSSIELGLERVGQVWKRLQTALPAVHSKPLVITVAGTNGKGSVCAILDTMLRAAGWRVGVYASPHLLHYCERVRVAGMPVVDSAMVAAFAAVDQARGDTSLTYFEFGTLAAFYLFQQQPLDVWILEVGMGGRLDAVNIIDSDLAIITNIALDHVEWLGSDRDSIAGEKAGIARALCPVVFGESDVPTALAQRVAELNSPLYCLGRDFHTRVLNETPALNEKNATSDHPSFHATTVRTADNHWHGDEWEYTGPLRLSDTTADTAPRAERALAQRSLHLPATALVGAHQRGNAALAITALGLLADRCPVTIAALVQGLQQVQLSGRMQIFHPDAAAAEVILDVAHNPHGMAVLAQALKQHRCSGRTYCVFSALKDKDLAVMLVPLIGLVDEWWLAALAGPRGRTLENLQQAFEGAGIEQPLHALQSLPEALRQARKAAQAEDRIVVCGSFLTVAAAVAALD